MTITLNMIARLICTFLLLCQVFGGASTYHTKDGLEKRVNVAVQTDSGLVQGHAAPQAPAISEYLGIPYAKPPVGELRFTHPQRYYGDDMINGTNFVRCSSPKSVARSHSRLGFFVSYLIDLYRAAPTAARSRTQFHGCWRQNPRSHRASGRAF